MTDLLSRPEAERAVLGAALRDQVSARQLVDELDSTYFTETGHVAIWSALVDVTRSGGAGALAVVDELRASGALARDPALAVLVAELDAQAPAGGQLDYWLTRLHDAYVRRSLVAAAVRLQQAASEAPTDTLRDVLVAVEQVIRDATRRPDTNQARGPRRVA